MKKILLTLLSAVALCVCACDKYDEAYFQSRILLLVLLEEGSGSVRHRVTGVTWSDDKRETLTVDVDVITPECGTCDMAE